MLGGGMSAHHCTHAVLWLFSHAFLSEVLAKRIGVMTRQEDPNNWPPKFWKARDRACSACRPSQNDSGAQLLSLPFSRKGGHLCLFFWGHLCLFFGVACVFFIVRKQQSRTRGLLVGPMHSPLPIPKPIPLPLHMHMLIYIYIHMYLYMYMYMCTYTYT